MNDPCPCGSHKAYAKCCGRFLDAGEKPRTPEQLMRSRYTAHVLGNRGEYLVQTWLTAVELGYRAADFTAQTVQWQKLEVLNHTQRGNIGTVEFKAYYLKSPVLQTGESGNLQVHHERSLFKRIEGVWYYVEALDTAG